jgi:hypothetical protein
MRVNRKRTPQCYPLEGRQLLNAGWGGPAAWGAAGDRGKPPAIVHHGEAGKGDPQFVDRGGPSGHFGQHAAPSAQTQTDMQTLQTDMKTLQSEIPASITAAVTADQATIKSALAAETPAQRESQMPAPGSWTPPSSSTTPPDPSAQLSTLLVGTGLSSTQITTIQSDFAAYQNALTTTDPTLQAKITADKAALAKDMPGMPTDAMGSLPGPMGDFGGPGFGPGSGP